MYAERHAIVPTTAADGSATAYSPVVTGRIISIQYVADGTAPYTNTVDATITGETTGQAILTVSNISAAARWAPRQPLHAVADASALLYAAAGTAVTDHIMLAAERVKIVLAQGGDTKTGTFYLTIG